MIHLIYSCLQYNGDCWQTATNIALLHKSCMPVKLYFWCSLLWDNFLTRACITRTLQIAVASGATLTAAASLAFQITLTTRTTLFTNIGTALYIFAIASTASWRAPFSLAFQITPSSTTSHITVISSAFNFTVSPWTAEGALCSRAFHVTISLLRRKKSQKWCLPEMFLAREVITEANEWKP